MNKKMYTFLVAFLMTTVIMSSKVYANTIENTINENIFGNQYLQDPISTTLQSSQIFAAQKNNGLDIFSYTLMPKQQRLMHKSKNKYALAEKDLSFNQSNNVNKDVNFWVKPYASFEDVRIESGERVKNNGYGAYVGANSGIKELGKGWDYILGGYLGYNGAYNSISELYLYQNGGTLGFENMFIKDNFFTGFNLSFGGATGSINDSFRVNYLNGGITNRTGYNFEFADGKFIIQPNLYTSYIFSQTFGHTQNFGGDIVSINSESMHTVQFEPGINFIGNLSNGWQPYAGVSLVINILPSGHFMPWYAAMPDMATRPIVKYGAGVRKSWNERFSGLFQVFVRNGGRNGVGLQSAISFALGK